MVASQGGRRGFRRRRELALVASWFVVACGGAISGVRQPLPSAGSGDRAEVTARATTSEPGGLRVLWNGRTHGTELDRTRAYLATNASEMKSLWGDVGRPSEEPSVDFSRYVVFGVVGGGGACPDEINAVQARRGGTLRVRSAGDDMTCIALLVRVAEVVAVPRVLAHGRVVFVPSNGETAFAFDVPETRPVALESSPLVSRMTSAVSGSGSGEVVALPLLGHIAQATLRDGSEIWVAHQRDGSVTVVPASARSDRAGNYRLGYNSKTGRFYDGHDARGTSVLGDRSLESYAATSVDDEHVRLGAIRRAAPAPVQSRQSAPILDGPEMPYQDREPVPNFDAIAEGHVALLDADVVFGLEGPGRICRAPKERKLLDRFPGCSPTAPSFWGSRSETRRSVVILDGPVVLRRKGNSATEVITSGYYGGRADVRPLPPPAPHGATRERGTLSVGTSLRGDTTNAWDGFSPQCVTTGGSPDESFRFVAPATGTYAFSLEADFDAALAIADGAGRTLACNDDRHGMTDASIVHVALERSGLVRGIVDGFGGDRGRYTVRVTADRPLAEGGRLPLGTWVQGDTRGATDDRSEGCSAPAGDDEWRLSVERPGTYRFVVEGNGWTPMLSIVDATTFAFSGCGFGKHEYSLAKGEWIVVVDGDAATHEGPYRLRAEGPLPEPTPRSP